MKRLVLAVLAVALVAPAARADHVESLIGPGEPARDFPADFLPRLPIDHQAEIAMFPQWSDRRIGGWGSNQCPAGHTPRRPVIFVHGTTEDATFWRANESGEGTIANVRQRYLDAGYCARELWAISYTGSRGYFTYNDINTEELYVFIREVRDYLGATQVDVIAHSLGVTVLRKAAFNHPEMYTWFANLIAIAGANHGTTACRGLGGTGVSHPCDELDPASPWLAQLNAFGQTPAGPRYLVLYSSTVDNWYQGPDAHSPVLQGACNTDMGPVAHNTLARGAEAVQRQLAWLGGGPCLS